MRRWGFAILGCGVLAACGAGMQDGASAPDAGGWWPDAATGTCFSSNDCPVGWSCSEFGRCEPPPVGGDAGGLPPEVEREFSHPSSALRYVYVAMTELDSLAKIDGASLVVTSVPVGDRPEIVATMPGTDDAVVLNRASATATIVRPTSANDVRVTLATLPHLNVLSMSPSSRYAIAWFDLTRAVIDAGGLDAVDGIGSFQDVTVLALGVDAEVAADLAVGFRPREVEFDDAGTRAYVITDDGVSVIDLAAAAAGEAHVAAAIPVVEDPLVDPATLEVEITGDGAYAIVRELGQPELRVVSLAGEDVGTIWSLPLPAEPTDVDLAPGGGRAYAVLRAAGQLAVVDVPGDAVDPAGLELVDLGDEIVGSMVLDPAGARAILFTNASDVERLTVVELAQPGYPTTVRPLQKGIRSVAFAPDGETALVFHSKRPGDPATATSVDELIDRSYGYSLLDLSSGFTKLARTDVDPGSFAFAPDRPRAYLALDGGDADGAVRRLQVIELDTFVVRDIDVGSPPEAVGILPGAGVAFVAQRHPLGRVTFVALDDACEPCRTDTITGFELGNHIVD